MKDIKIQHSTDKYFISTVSLPFNHSFDGGEEWYETMIFPLNEWSELFCQRYATAEEAEVAHKQIVAEVEAGRLP